MLTPHTTQLTNRHIRSSALPRLVGVLLACVAAGIVGAGSSASALAAPNAVVDRFEGARLHDLAGTTLPTGLTAIVPENYNGLELLYNANTGLAKSVTINDKGTMTTRWSGEFNRGWTSVVNSTIGSMLFYNASSGVGVAVTFDSNGVPTSLPSFKVKPGYPTVVGLQGGELFYNASTGSSLVGGISGSGRFTSYEEQTQSPGWQIILPVASGTGGMDFFYNPNGLTALAHWRYRLKTIATFMQYTISNGWSATTIIPGDPDDEQAYYRAPNGLMLVPR